MKTFPMFLKVANRRVVIIGGGEQAAQKSRLILKTEAELVLVAPELEAELSDLVQNGRAHHVLADTPGLFDGAALVFAATGCKGADSAWHARAKAAGALVNVVDYPELCDAITPSIVDRDPVVVAIGTEGTAPILGRRLKTRIEEILHPRLGVFAALAGRLRGEVARRVPFSDRRAFWRWVFGEAPWKAFAAGREREAAGLIKAAIQAGGSGGQGGRLTVVTGASDAGLVPLGAVEALQEADMVCSDRGVPMGVLDLARRDAERVWLSASDRSAWEAGSISGLLATLANDKSVVCLTTALASSVLQRGEILPEASVLIECATSSIVFTSKPARSA
jgi:uroporphyrin-III C-methyltransferase/precorrin-2 dehydrogenase/sirohydrochlorin ferrochelatase